MNARGLSRSGVAKRRRLARLLTVGTALLIAIGCDTVASLVGMDLEFAYVGDDSGAVEVVSVATGTRVIASARRARIRKTENPEISELDVDETHYVRGTLEVVYKGRLVFQCRTGQETCDRTASTPASGSRPRDLFRVWPLKIGRPILGAEMASPILDAEMAAVWASWVRRARVRLTA